MRYRTFGRTGLSVSVAGIGTGGPSRVGLETGATESDAVALLRRAVELGVNYFDTAESYGTEQVVGLALKAHRDELVLSSKVSPRRADGTLRDGRGLREALESALARMQTDVLDVYHLHRPAVEDYGYCRDELVPELLALRDEGKLRFLAISGSTSPDPTHPLLRRAVEDDCWDVVMVAFNLFNQSARTGVFPATIRKDLAVEIMSAAPGPFSHPERFAEVIGRLLASGELAPGALDDPDPLAFLAGAGTSLAGTSYRFAAYEPGVHVVLTGTGNLIHLEENVRALDAGPLPEDVRSELIRLFGHLALPTAQNLHPAA